MIRLWIIIPFLLLVLQGEVLGSDLDSVLKGVNKKYHHMPGLVTSYTREVITRSMSMLGSQARGDLATGQIYFTPPRWLRMDQLTPERETVIASEDKIWWYVPNNNCVYLYSTKEFGRGLSILSEIFSGFTRVKENFAVAMVSDPKQEEYQIRLTPHTPWQEIDHITITLTKDYDVRVVDICNQFGTITRFRLENLIVKNNFEKDFFQFVVPEGARLVDRDAQ